MTARAHTVTILFTDLVGSTELLQRAGDEQAQRIFKAHHRLLREAVEAHGGHEVKWLGDGLMVAFDSTADAVKCAIAMQQASRRPTAGERLEIRVGLHVGEAFVDESDYFGTSVVIARRLCDSSGAGQIRASDIVVRLLDGRGDGIRTKDLGQLDLKGITNPVPAVEIEYAHDPLAVLRRLPFVGRHAEYETLVKKLADARNGRGSVVLLAGEPGIGKTRLTEEFCDHAASSGAAVIRGNCYEGDVAAPFGPWTEALRSLIDRTPGTELRDTLGLGAPDIAAMLPEVRRRLHDIEEAPRLEPEAERARLFESLNAWLRSAADKRPLVIFFDDLHWCDRPSLALLEQVARNSASQRIVIVGTYRDAEVDRVHPLAQTLASLRRMEHYERLSLHGFTREGVSALLAAIEPSEEAAPGREALAQVLQAGSEGNPFFIREVLNHLIETGTLRHEGGRWQGGGASVEDLGIPEGIREVIGRRLSHLSDAANRVLQRASAMPGGFTWEELCAICDEPESDLLDVLDEALGAQLITERERNTYAFTHALIRATLYDELSTPRRVQLHRHIAEALESLYAGQIEDHLGELAAHYLASTGSAVAKAVEYAVRAGDRAMELFAFEEAAVHYQRGLDASAISGDAATETSVRTMIKLERAQKYAGAIELATDTARRAVEVARPMSPEIFAQAAVAFAEIVWVLWARPSLRDEAQGTLEEALEVLGEHDSAERVLALSYATRMAGVAEDDIGSGGGGITIYAGGRSEHDVARAREAVDMAERLNDPRLRAVAISNLLGCQQVPERAQDNAQLAEEMLRLANLAGDVDLQVEALSWLNRTKAALGDSASAQAIIDEFEARSVHTRAPAHQRWGPYLRAEVARREGRFEQSKVLAREAYELALRGGVGEADYTHSVQAAYTLWHEGRLHEAAGVLRAQAEASPNTATQPLALAISYLEQEDRSNAAQVLSVVADPSRYRRDAFYLTALDFAASVCFLTGDKPFGEELYPLFGTLPTLICQTGGIGLHSSTTGAAARVATVLGLWDEAEQKFLAAIEQLERTESPVLVARTRWEFAEMLLRRNAPGDRERAITLAQQAHDFAASCGMGFVERKSSELLASLA